MASSGWQNEQTAYTLSANWRLAANISIDSITHSGSNLRIVGTIAVGARGTNGYYAYFNDGIYARATTQGDGAIVSGGTTMYVGGTDYYRGFDVTIGGVSEQTTSFNFSIVVRDGANQYFNTRLYWTLNFDASTVAPSGADIAFVSSTWNSVTMTTSVASWGSGYSGTPGMQGIFVDPTATSSDWTNKGRVVKGARTSSLTYTFNDVSNTNFDATYDGGYTLKGMTPYKIAVWAATSVGTSSKLDNTTRYTPPAPGQITYTETSTGVFMVEYTGVAANNYSGYTASELTRNVRYRERGTSAWTDVTSGVEALTTVTQATIIVPAGKTYEVEAWMTYRGNQSEVSAITVTNSANPVALYASARGVSKKVAKLYGSVNGQTKKIKKLYGSAGGVSKLIFEDNS